MKPVQDNKDIKLSKPQKEVIKLMREGWELGVRGLMNDVSFKHIPSHTIQSLERLKLIERLTEISIFSFQLTELGKSIQL